MCGVDFLKLIVLNFFGTKNLDDVHTRDVFLHKRAEISHRRANFVERIFDFFFENVGTNQHKRHGRKANERQPPIGVKHNTND